MSGNSDAGYLAEEVADARLPPKAEVLAILESLTLSFLESLARGEEPSLHLVGVCSVELNIFIAEQWHSVKDSS